MSWTQLDEALPFPLALKDMLINLAVRSSDFVAALDQQMLRITHLRASKYTVKIDGSEIGVFTREQLARGVNLAVLDTPMLRQAQRVHLATMQHNNVHLTRFQRIEVPLEETIPAARALELLDAAEDEIVSQQRLAARPVPHRFEVVPVAESTN